MTTIPNPPAHGPCTTALSAVAPERSLLQLHVEGRWLEDQQPLQDPGHCRWAGAVAPERSSTLLGGESTAGLRSVHSPMCESCVHSYLSADSNATQPSWASAGQRTEVSIKDEHEEFDLTVELATMAEPPCVAHLPWKLNCSQPHWMSPCPLSPHCEDEPESQADSESESETEEELVQSATAATTRAPAVVPSGVSAEPAGQRAPPEPRESPVVEHQVMKDMNDHVPPEKPTQPRKLDVNRRLEYLFQIDGKARWFGGTLKRDRGEWADVAFDDGEKSCVKMLQHAEGTVWRWQRDKNRPNLKKRSKGPPRQLLVNAVASTIHFAAAAPADESSAEDEGDEGDEGNGSGSDDSESVRAALDDGSGCSVPQRSETDSDYAPEGESDDEKPRLPRTKQKHRTGSGGEDFTAGAPFKSRLPWKCPNPGCRGNAQRQGQNRTCNAKACRVWAMENPAHPKPPATTRGQKEAGRKRKLKKQQRPTPLRKKSRYRGLSYRYSARGGGKWCVSVGNGHGGKTFVGGFPGTDAGELAAAKAYDAAARRLRGKLAHGGEANNGSITFKVNFPTEAEKRIVDQKHQRLAKIEAAARAAAPGDGRSSRFVGAGMQPSPLARPAVVSRILASHLIDTAPGRIGRIAMSN